MTLKEDLTNSAIARATSITEYHLFLTSKHPPLLLDPDKKVPPWVSESTLKDAAQLWLTAAKEGSPAAARELALFYLTHPDLVKRTTKPMARGHEVFGMGKIPSGAGGALDTQTFSVVLHWMEVAASGGDKEASDFLRENGAVSNAVQS